MGAAGAAFAAAGGVFGAGVAFMAAVFAVAKADSRRSARDGAAFRAETRARAGWAPA
jgi:hypothetical protein